MADYTQDANCQGAWLFTEGSGTTVADASQNSNTGNFKGDGEPAWVGSVSGTNAPTYATDCVLFDGGDDHINCGNSASMNMPLATIVAWIKPDADASDAQIVGRDESAGAGRDFQFRKGDTDKLEFIIFVGNSAHTCVSSASIAEDSDTWSHVAGTYDGETILTWINGSNDGTQASPSGNMDNDGGVLGIGARTTNASTWTEWFDGAITEVAIFNRVLNSTEINDIMDNGLAGAAGSASPSATPSGTPSATPSATPSSSPSEGTPSATPSGTPSATPSATPSGTPSGTPSSSPSEGTPSASPSVGYQNYTMDNLASLPADNADLTTDYTSQNLIDVALDDATRVSQVGSDNYYAIHQFKDYAGTGDFTVTWNGQSSLAPSVSPVYLEIYNTDTTTWDSVASNDVADADTDFTLTNTPATPSDYKDLNNIVTCRVYQQNV